MIDEESLRKLETRHSAISRQLDERQRRLFVAAEARAAGYGGIAAVSRVTGVAASTIGRGLKELEAPSAKFMRAIGAGDRIFVVLSDKYLQSPFCMFELFEIWRNSRQDRTEFLRRVLIYTLGDAKIWTPLDRVRCAKYWKDRHDELKQAVDEAGLDALGEEDFRNYKLMQDFASKVGDILALFANIVQPRSFDDLKSYGFDDPPPTGSARAPS